MSKLELELFLILDKIQRINAKSLALREDYVDAEFSFFKSVCLNFQSQEPGLLDVRLVRFFLEAKLREFGQSR